MVSPDGDVTLWSPGERCVESDGLFPVNAKVFTGAKKEKKRRRRRGLEVNEWHQLLIGAFSFSSFSF